MKYLLLAIFFIYSCGSVPVTGRKQLLLVPDGDVLTLSLQEYNDFIKSAPISTDKKNTEMVVRVGSKIATAVENYLKNNGLESELANFAWEFKLVKSPQVNAFCMPGGKIVIYEGILPVTQTEAGLAVVIGHEVAHAVAKHANERMSQQMATQYGGTALDVLLSTQKSETKVLADQVFGLGAEYLVMLPYSRKQEYEADRLGAIFMAMAGYNPEEAITFWSRMAAQGSGKTSDFFSTHPSDQKRIEAMKKVVPEAMKYYSGATGVPPKSKTSSQWSF